MSRNRGVNMLRRRKSPEIWQFVQAALKRAAQATLSVILFGTLTVQAQSPEALTADSLTLDKLNYEKELTALYLGDFTNSGLQPNDGPFASVFPAYVTSFARNCAAYLPSNRVEIKKQECARESTPVNAFGNPVGPTTCVEYRNVGTGLYAKPELLAISQGLQAIQGGQLLGNIFNRSDDPMAMSRKMTDVLLLAGDDMSKLFGLNKCDSPALQRLEDNMARFAQGGTPLRLASGDTLAEVMAGKPKHDLSKPADHARLIDDLITENSKGWAFNRYIRGSVGNVSVRSRDAQGRPQRISANYRFSQMGQAVGGSVELAFQKGLPKCLFFFDAPSTCRVPSPRIANAYERGEY